MAESQDVIERDEYQDNDEGSDTADAVMNGEPSPTTMTTTAMILDRSRCQLRLPANLVTESLRFAHALKYSRNGIAGTGAADSELVTQLRAAGIIVGDDLDPLAADLLRVANQASLIINVELRFGSDASSSTVWATPRQAVVSSSLDPAFAEFRPVDVMQLPYVLSELMVSRPPTHVADAPISVATQAVAEAEAVLDQPDRAAQILVDAGLSPEQAQTVLDFQDADVRRWRVNSTWSTDDGQDSSELRGIDAGENGQWLVAMTGSREDRGQLTFTPQGHGDVMRALRSILPRSWVGTPLKNPGI
ncbi:MAG: ESX secretion-associated protein EspG [Acidimicrobiia bacterium]|nr:ESX secretion-associated protein EspG [Acidimicrobiia bacterium]